MAGDDKQLSPRDPAREPEHEDCVFLATMMNRAVRDVARDVGLGARERPRTWLVLWMGAMQ